LNASAAGNLGRFEAAITGF